MKSTIRIGCGAGFSGDRLEPALLLAEKGNLDYLVLECLAERTIALANQRKMQDPRKGYDLLLERRMESLLPLLAQNKVRLITNMGAANPVEGARKVMEIAQKLGLKVKVAAVSGDDLFSHLPSGGFNFDHFQIIDEDLPLVRNPVSPIRNQQVISANAYLGTEGILEALNQGADIVITGRVADPSLFLAPMMYAFGWASDNFDLMGKGTIIGHLLECAGQVTGGYFADNYKKTVPGLASLGHPIAEIAADGTSVISKVDGTGGIINLQTVKEQLLYEVLNPHEYITPDVVADFTSVRLQQTGENRVSVSGGSGKTRPANYKASVGYKAFFLGEGEISYAGHHALARAELAGSIVQERLKNIFSELRIDYIGLSSAHHTTFGAVPEPNEIRLRVAAKGETREQAALVGEEVEALYTNGPAGGGGARKFVSEIIGIVSVLVDRNTFHPSVQIFES
ncbi:MAG TPA: DUF1446 domain-containing protein [Saprospiraceae bacterium]|nr:DUF1446 domain-containing protein [Saprospiraceae bacterium]